MKRVLYHFFRESRLDYFATALYLDSIAAELQELFACKVPDAQTMKVPGKPIDMLRPDLEATGIEYQDDSDRVVDFHSLRHTTATLLASVGTHPKTIQSMMRHSTVGLSMDVYAHVLRDGEAKAIADLPDLSAPSSNSQRAVKTGTDDANVTDSVLALRLAHLGARQRPTMSSREKVTGTDDSASGVYERARQDSNLQPSDSKSEDQNSQTPLNTPLSETPNSVLASCFAQIVQKHPDLPSLIQAWPTLPEQTKAEITAIIEEHSKEAEHNVEKDDQDQE